MYQTDGKTVHKAVIVIQSKAIADFFFFSQVFQAGDLWIHSVCQVADK